MNKPANQKYLQKPEVRERRNHAIKAAINLKKKWGVNDIKIARRMEAGNRQPAMPAPARPQPTAMREVNRIPMHAARARGEPTITMTVSALIALVAGARRA